VLTGQGYGVTELRRTWIAALYDARLEPGDHLAGAVDEELLEVPGDVAAAPGPVRDLHELVVHRVPVGAVDLHLLGHREGDPVGG
jgi:hypothetical protein